MRREGFLNWCNEFNLVPTWCRPGAEKLIRQLIKKPDHSLWNDPVLFLQNYELII